MNANIKLTGFDRKTNSLVGYTLDTKENVSLPNPVAIPAGVTITDYNPRTRCLEGYNEQCENVVLPL